MIGKQFPISHSTSKALSDRREERERRTSFCLSVSKIYWALVMFNQQNEINWRKKRISSVGAFEAEDDDEDGGGGVWYRRLTVNCEDVISTSMNEKVDLHIFSSCCCSFAFFHYWLVLLGADDALNLIGRKSPCLICLTCTFSLSPLFSLARTFIIDKCECVLLPRTRD